MIGAVGYPVNVVRWRRRCRRSTHRSMKMKMADVLKLDHRDLHIPTPLPAALSRPRTSTHYSARGFHHCKFRQNHRADQGVADHTSEHPDVDLRPSQRIPTRRATRLILTVRNHEAKPRPSAVVAGQLSHESVCVPHRSGLT